MKLLKNRLVIGCICIVLAFVIGFLVVPKLTDMMNDKVTIVVAKQDIKKGDTIKPEMMTMIEMSKGDVPYAVGEYFNFIDNGQGKVTDNKIMISGVGELYASVDMKALDIVTTKKLSTTYPYSDESLRILPNNKYAVAVSVKSLAAGVAAKVKSGDIVTFLVNGEENENITSASVYNELMYVQIISVTNSDATDITDSTTENTVPSVITVEANLYQAELLAGLEAKATMHLALVSRGDEAKAAELLAKQEKYFTDNYPPQSENWYYDTYVKAAEPTAAVEENPSAAEENPAAAEENPAAEEVTLADGAEQKPVEMNEQTESE